MTLLLLNSHIFSNPFQNPHKANSLFRATCMDHSNNSLWNIAIISLLFTGVLYLCLWPPSSLSNPLSSFQNNINCPHSPLNLTRIKLPIDELELALEKASMPNKTVIIAVVNKAYVEQSVDGEMWTMLDLFLESLWLGEGTRPLLDHLLIVAVDQTAYDRCRFKRLHCYKLKTEGVDFGGEKIYMSQDFIKMMWTRTLLLLDVLNHGYSFIFTDTDVMWLRNPFSRLSSNQSLDLQISVDKYRSRRINTGFYYVRSNNNTISLFHTWYNMRDNSTGLKEQDVLFALLKSGLFHQLGLNIKFLNTFYFSGFCQDSPDFRAVTTVHANCCRHIGAKVNDLAVVLHDWKRYKAATPGDDNRMRIRWSPHVKCLKSWNDTHYNPPS